MEIFSNIYEELHKHKYPLKLETNSQATNDFKRKLLMGRNRILQETV